MTTPEENQEGQDKPQSIESSLAAIAWHLKDISRYLRKLSEDSANARTQVSSR